MARASRGLQRVEAPELVTVSDNKKDMGKAKREGIACYPRRFTLVSQEIEGGNWSDVLLANISAARKT